MNYQLRKFLEPLSEPFKYETIKKHWILYILAPLSVIPIREIFKNKVDSFWGMMGIIILWWIIIGFIDLLYWYIKNKE